MCIFYKKIPVSYLQTCVNTNTYFIIGLNMWNFVPKNYDLPTALIFCYHLKKTAAESHRMLVEAYGEHTLGKSQCFWVV